MTSKTIFGTIAAVVVCLLVILAGGYGLFSYLEGKKDDDAFRAALAGGGIEQLESYLSLYPLGRHVSEARRAMDDKAFRRAEAGGTISHYETYLRQYPEGHHLQEAKQAIEDIDWETTPKNIDGYLAFLKKHPAGKRAAEARNSAETMAWEKFGNQGAIVGLQQYVDLFPQGAHTDEAKAEIDRKLTCNRQYAQDELARIKASKGIEASSTGASNVISTKRGSAYSNTTYSDNTATTYYHDGSYSSQDGVTVNYRIRNNTQFLVFNRIEGVASFRTKAGVFWRGFAGAFLGGTWNESNGKDTIEGMKAGAKKGYDMARHSEKIVIDKNLAPGESYQGSVYMKAKYKVLNSEFQAERIDASISESMLVQRNAPGC
jgi:hypothetical protein